MPRRSIVEYFAEHERYSCGYCKSKDTNYSHGMWGHYLTVEDYLDLINRGWRRSGEYCYKPIMNLTCCPQYAISCKALEFKLSKSQKKLLKRTKNFLINGRSAFNDKSSPSSKIDEHSTEQDMPEFIQNPSVVDENLFNCKNDPITVMEQEKCDLETNCQDITDPVSYTGDSNKPECSLKGQIPSVKGLDPNRPPCKKAKAKRREKFVEKLLKNGIDPNTYEKKRKCEEKNVEDFLGEFPKNAMHRLKWTVVPCSFKNQMFCKTFDDSYALYCKYQIAIHLDPPEKCTKSQFKKFLVKNPLDDTGDPGYKGFFGSYHHQYYLDDKLIAVGVIDILTNCVSSVYLYYDPEYSFMSLGTFAALCEIAYTRELNKKYPSIKYYYMGFYIHSCHKMRYKGNYTPSFLLCPEAYTFHPLEDCVAKLDASKYSRLNVSDQSDEDGIVHLNEVLIVYNNRGMQYPMYSRESNAEDEQEVSQYANLVGRKCYRRILLFRCK